MGKHDLKYLIVCIGLILLSSTQLCAQENRINSINKSIENSEWAKFSNYCQETISLSVQDSRGNFSKTQARYILADFFKKNPAIKITLIRSNKISDRFYYSILESKTKNKLFNIYYTIQKTEDSFLINEIQIKEKSK